MKPRFLVFSAIAATMAFALAGPASRLPDQWVVTGESPQLYEAAQDLSRSASGKGASLTIRSLLGANTSWASLATATTALPYRGQRIRLNAKVQTADLEGWAGLWMRVDAPKRFAQAFYNNIDKPIGGTTPWQKTSVVLDVADDAYLISYGVINSGKGQVWIDEVSIEVVGKEIPVDVMPGREAVTEARKS